MRGDDPKTVQFLDPKKAQNIAIALRKVCGGSSKAGTSELAERLRVLDLDNPLAAENCEVLIDSIPQVLGSGLEQYAGPEDRLPKIELHLLNLVRVPRLIPRLKMMLFIGQIDELHNLAAADVGQLARASAQVKGSSILREVLKVALSVGNYVNTGSENENWEVRGITLDSVVKMRQFKM